MNRTTLLTILLFCCGFVGVNAQDADIDYLAAPSKNDYLLKDPLWSVSVGVGLQTYFGEDDGKAAFAKRLTFAPTISLSRRLTNLFSVRLQLTGGTLHGYNDGDSGFYTRWTTKKHYRPTDVTFDPQWDYMGWVEGIDYARIHVGNQNGWTSLHRGELYLQSMKYIGAYGDFSLNLLNLIEGYKPNRIVEVTPFVGIGMFNRFGTRGLVPNVMFGTSLGLNASYRFSKDFSAFAEWRGTLVPDEFDGQVSDLDMMPNDGLMHFTAGISYNFGQPRYIDPALDRRLSMPYNIARSKDNMVLVPGGNVEMGAGIDPVWGDSTARQVMAVSPFWMDETEVTNKQYREFVFWVRDSLIRERLADPAYGGDPTFKVLARPGAESSASAVGQRLNWSKPIPWKNPTEREASAIASVINGNPFGADRATLDGSLLNYKYSWFDEKGYYSAHAKLAEGNYESITVTIDTAYVNRSGAIVRETLTRQSYGNEADFTNTYIVNVYPDVMSWITDFANAKNEQYVKNYFNSKPFEDFPVVGVSWEQADAYCVWRTDLFRVKSKNKYDGYERYRLPTEAEWEFAARNGRSELRYPWYSDDTHTSNGLANSNFRESRDLKGLVSPVATFLPNRFGLYDMAGNVAEWTTTTYNESIDLMVDVVNPDYSYRAVNSDPDILKRKVIKGGSWKDTSEFIRSDMRLFEQQDKGRSYIGFRCVRSWGIDKKGNFK